MSWAKPPFKNKKSYPHDPRDNSMTPWHMPSLYGKAFEKEKKARKRR